MTDDIITYHSFQLDPRADEAIEVAKCIGKAVADWLPTTGSVVVVALPTYPKIREALIEGMRLQGRNVIDGGSGDGETAVAYIKTVGVSGGAVIGYSKDTEKVTIEVYQEDGLRLETDTGLMEVYELLQAGNFVPAATKGELTAIA